MKKIIFIVSIFTFLLSACNNDTKVNNPKIDEIFKSTPIDFGVRSFDYSVAGMRYKVFNTVNGIFVVNVTKDSLWCANYHEVERSSLHGLNSK